MTQRKYTNGRYLDALEKKVLVFDGAMGTSLQRQNLTAEHFGGEMLNGCNDYLVISYPQAVETVHRSFLDVGVDVIETDTFRANRLTLGEYGLVDRVREVLRRDFLCSDERADKLSGAWGRHPLLGRMYLPAYRAGTVKVAELRRRHAPEVIIPALFGAQGLVDLVTIDAALPNAPRGRTRRTQAARA